ncbi:NEFA-interacting nuclear protein NIP30 [Piptocephalis cylindrospora]|uniref:NEFA-interacting nuclear protein NIP30 n=1 Tax=Piptocephalis cylindrospora TaxID=1907219 RepID=A0A4P9Y2X4_9FUNG|nr:NEFA-interacting nuclear protein NIP30 [Piptocephalis cylindrospora]|eukprot:RKP13276.1 NEFA-interacting nuclear protein NIP30 [Piptocephalis cylindrospora]
MDPPHYTSEAPPASSINIKSSFVSQDALDQSRARREEEWKRAHANADNPPPMPEEPYDPRTLYERLKEQRDRKEADFEEATRLGNLVHRLDNEEANFLDEMVEERKKKERALEEEEKAALAQFRR